ncbi:TIGR04104 family putative zinc finger protein [Bacillus infantis]|uniref:TIGR04104 family putative zinc finger protein n=1 Tax=Bacillus infantis TaxID=324767 RepID=UPI003CF3FF10
MGGVSSLQKCKKCHAPFSWRKIYRILWREVNQPVICDKCGSEHYVTLGGRLVNTFLVIGPLTIFAGIIAPFDNIYLDLGGGILLAFLGSLLVPYLTILKVDGESLYSN